MKMRKINLDRSPVDSKEILARRNFNRVLENYHVMAKPFYKSAWFFGTAGIASVGLLIGGSLMLQDSERSETTNLENTSAPPNDAVFGGKLIALDANRNNVLDKMLERTLRADAQIYQSGGSIGNDVYSADVVDVPAEAVDQPVEVQPVSDIGVNEVNARVESVGIEIERNGFSHMSIHPRISGKIGGPITREELFDLGGLTTEADVSIVHFELHLVEGPSGRVFEQEGNQLNEEMKAAMDRVMVGENIYFENIRGKSRDGEVVKLNPLRYVLLN